MTSLAGGLSKRVTSWFRASLRAEDKPLTAIVFSIGVLIALFEYWGYQENERAKKSYDHIGEWESDGYQASFECFGQFVQENEGEAAVQLEELGLPDSDIALQKLTYVQNAVANAGPDAYSTCDESVEDSVRRIIYFFDKSYVCVDRGLCDRDLMRAFFGENFKRFWIYAEGYVAKERTQIAGFAELSEAYVTELSGTSKSIWSGLFR